MATPEVLGQISKATGVDPARLSKGLSAVGATTLGSLAASAKTPEGAAALQAKLPTDASASGSPTDILTGLMGSLTGCKGGTSAHAMTSILGSGSNAISGTLSKSLGFNIKPLMAIGTPMLMGLLGKAVKSGNLDAKGTADLLQTQAADFAKDPANAEMAGVVNSALAASDKASALRGTFTDKEWAQMRGGPLAAIGLVMAASPTKGGGADGELAAGAGSILQSAEAAEPASLHGSAFGGGPTHSELDAVSKLTPTSERALAAIKAGATVVKAKDASASAAYSTMIVNAPTATAEATKEGGFLGIGGTVVSDQETTAISAINAALA